MDYISFPLGLEKSLFTLKFQSLVNIIEPDLDDGPWIAGGAVRWLKNGGRIHTDVDVFFKTETQYTQCNEKLQFYLKRHHSSNNAVTYYGLLSTQRTARGNLFYDRPVQLIRRQFYLYVEDMLEDFDFDCCKLVTDGDIVIAHKNWEDSTLIFDPYHSNDRASRLPVRLVKYLSYGYKIDQESLKKLNDYAQKSNEFCIKTGY